MTRIISLIFSLCVFAVWLYFQGVSINMLSWSLDTQAFYQDMSDDFDTRGNETGAAQKPQGTRLTMQEHALNISGELAFDPKHFVRNRSVATQRQFDLAEILNEGEPVPEPDLLSFYVMARVPSVMLRECALLLEALATSCRVAKTSLRKLRDGSYILSADLQYLPGYAMGIPKNKAGEIVRHTHDMTPKTPQPDSAEERARQVAKALKLCAALKAKYGNCFVDRISFVLHSVPLTPEERRLKPSERVPKPLTLHTHTSLSVHGLWTDVNEQTLEVAVTELIAAP